MPFDYLRLKCGLGLAKLVRTGCALLVAITFGLSHTASANGAEAALRADAADPTMNVVRPSRRNILNFVTHTEIEIDRAPGAVWPYIVNTNAWTTRKLRHPRGPAGEVGEVFALINAAQPDVVLAWAENVELVPDQRRTFKVYGPDGRIRAYVSWKLQGVRSRTVVFYDIYYESVLAEQTEQTDVALARQRQEGQELAIRQAKAELAGLKKLVESPPAQESSK